MATVGIDQFTADRVKHAIPACDEQVGPAVSQQQLIHPQQRLDRLLATKSRRAQIGTAQHHEQRCRYAFVGHVRDDNAPFTAFQWDEIIKITANLSRRPVKHGQFPTRYIWQLLRQETALNSLRDLKFAIHPLTLG